MIPLESISIIRMLTVYDLAGGMSNSLWKDHQLVIHELGHSSNTSHCFSDLILIGEGFFTLVPAQFNDFIYVYLTPCSSGWLLC